MFHSVRVPLLCFSMFAVTCSLCSFASAESAAQRAIGFSKLLFRPQDRWVSQSDDQTRVMVLEYMRSKNLNAVGAENLVFNKDSSTTAELVLGGTIFDLDCEDYGELSDCLMGVRWEVLDVARDEVIYRAQVYGVFHKDDQKPEDAIRLLIRRSIDRLVAKPQFQTLVAARHQEKKKSAKEKGFPPATVKYCSKTPIAVEEDGNWALGSVVLIRSGSGIGGGFVFSDEPFVLTAAHVVTVARPEVQFKNGHQSRASVVRIDREADVALLRVEDLPGDATCLDLGDSRDVTPGASVFVLGAPGGEDLAFSVSRGILSGKRLKNGVNQLQTDASINLGNSGGPMLNAKGEALGIVSWKFAGETVEGLGFAVAIRDAMDRLGISTAPATSSSLTQQEQASQEDRLEIFTEPAEPRPPLEEPETEHDLARAKRYESSAFTAPYVVRLSPSIGLAHYPDGKYEINDGSRSSTTAPEIGFGVSTTFAFGLHVAYEFRLAPIPFSSDCVAPGLGRTANCVTPLLELGPLVGFDLPIGSHLILRPKVGPTMSVLFDDERIYAAGSAGLDIPIRLGNSRLALTPFVGGTIPFEDLAPTSESNVRAGVRLEVGVGRLAN